jgi:valyl-tRNA synthetase
MLRASGDLDGEPKPTTRMTNFYEKGDKPLEIVATRQWYISNGGKDLNLRGELLRRGGEELDWVPDYMRNRYTNWVEGLNSDWLISRQRFFGVPFPLWYPLDEEGEPNWESPILASEESLPIDPMSTPAPGYTEEQRDQPGGFTADKDVMDTWATSSLSPQIVCGWGVDDELFNLTFPMDLAPQAHDIIRTWLFSRVVRSHLEFNSLPWERATVSGFVVDPDRKKFSKSKGNAVVPTEILAKFGSDAVRWRAAMARPGADSPFDETQMKVGRRLAVKVLNASKFVLGMGSATPISAVTEPIDLALLEALKGVVSAATASFEAFDYTSALEVTEAFFWSFCDDTIELLKERAYGNLPGVNGTGAGDSDDSDEPRERIASPAALSARAALQTALNVLQRLFAPYLPFVTEEVWSWWQEGSIHQAAWPTVAELSVTGDVALLSAVSEALSGIRGAKSNAKMSQKTTITRIEFAGEAATLDLLKLAESDLRAVGSIIGDVVWTPQPGPLTVSAELLAPTE